MTDTVEVERKFLVDRAPAEAARGAVAEIIQGYLAVGGGSEVRLRRKNDQCSLTVKHGAGLARAEVEIILDSGQFDTLWPATEGRRVEKTRVEISIGCHTAELDRYHGALAGLSTVEVEFSTVGEAERFNPPSWFGREVTDDPRYANNRLALEGRPATG